MDEKVHTMAETVAFAKAAVQEALAETRKLILTAGATRRPLVERFDEFAEDLLSKI